MEILLEMRLRLSYQVLKKKLKIHPHPYLKI